MPCTALPVSGVVLAMVSRDHTEHDGRAVDGAANAVVDVDTIHIRLLVHQAGSLVIADVIAV